VPPLPFRRKGTLGRPSLTPTAVAPDPLGHGARIEKLAKRLDGMDSRFTAVVQSNAKLEQGQASLQTSVDSIQNSLAMFLSQFAATAQAQAGLAATPVHAATVAGGALAAAAPVAVAPRAELPTEHKVAKSFLKHASKARRQKHSSDKHSLSDGDVDIPSDGSCQF